MPVLYKGQAFLVMHSYTQVCPLHLSIKDILYVQAQRGQARRVLSSALEQSRIELRTKRPKQFVHIATLSLIPPTQKKF